MSLKNSPLIGWVAARIIKLLGGTLRWSLEDRAGYLTRPLDAPILVAAWHNRILALPLCYQWMCRARRPLTVLTSPSRDGALLESLVAQFGIGAVRGSSSKRGITALRELQAELEKHTDVIITPDGPRGPVYKLSPGIVFLASKTRLPIMVVRVTYERFWEMRSWDKFRVPKPFSRVNITFLPLVQTGEATDDASIAQECAKIEALLGSND